MAKAEDRAGDRSRVSQGAQRTHLRTLPHWSELNHSKPYGFALYPPATTEIVVRSERLMLFLPFSAGAAELGLEAGSMYAARVRAGSVTLIEPHITIRIPPGAAVEFLLMAVEPDHFQSIATQAVDGQSWQLRRIVDYLDPTSIALAAEIRRALLSDNFVQPAYLRFIADALMARLSCQLVTEENGEAQQQSLSPGNLQKIARHIDENLADDLRVADLSALVGLSRSHFSRVFKQMTGDTPQRFILLRRLCRARDLIAAGSDSLARIAAQAGFSSQAHMTDAFRNELGVTPARYRDSLRRDGSESL